MKLLFLFFAFTLFVPGCGGDDTPGDLAASVQACPDLAILAVGAEHCRISWRPLTGQLADCQYRVVLSTNDDINTLEEARNRGQIIRDFTPGVNDCHIYPLRDNRVYYVNVIARDRYDNCTVYKARRIETLDRDAPRPGDGGRISTVAMGSNSITIAWTPATDRLDPSGTLTYRVYASTNVILDTRGRIQADGVPVSGSLVATNTAVLSGLAFGTRYSLNILVENSRGILAAYAVHQAETVDDVPPLPGGGGTILGSEVTSNAFRLTWTAASDPFEPQEGLQYRVYISSNAYASGDGTMDTLAEVLANGTPLTDWVPALTAYRVTNLAPATCYWCNVLVRDRWGNMAVYREKYLRTTDMNGNYLIDGGLSLANGYGLPYWKTEWYCPSPGNDAECWVSSGHMYGHTGSMAGGRFWLWLVQYVPWVPGESARLTAQTVHQPAKILKAGAKLYIYLAFKSPGGTSLADYEDAVTIETIGYETPWNLLIDSIPAPPGTTKVYIEMGGFAESTLLAGFFDNIRLTRIENP